MLNELAVRFLKARSLAMVTKGCHYTKMASIQRLDPNFVQAFDGYKIAHDLIRKLVVQKPVLRAILFGSAAENRNTCNSDLDILVIVSDLSDLTAYYAFVNTPFFSPIAVDWIFKKESDFELEKDIGGVSRIASLTGKNISIRNGIDLENARDTK